jgi:hypothetical protein
VGLTPASIGLRPLLAGTSFHLLIPSYSTPLNAAVEGVFTVPILVAAVFENQLK